MDFHIRQLNKLLKFWVRLRRLILERNGFELDLLSEVKGLVFIYGLLRNKNVYVMLWQLQTVV